MPPNTMQMKFGRTIYHDAMIALLKTQPKYVKAWYLLDPWVAAHPGFMGESGRTARIAGIGKILSDLLPRWNQNRPSKGWTFVNIYSEL